MKHLSISIIFLFINFLTIQAQNVGIGTANPQHKLVVEGDRINLQNKAGNKFFFIRTDGEEIDITTIGSHFWITAAENKHLILNPNVNSSGNVGIGTNNPTEKLHIAGGARINSLEGEGNRFLFASPTGIVSASTLKVSELVRSNQALKEKVNQQEKLIQDLIKRVEELEKQP